MLKKLLAVFPLIAIGSFADLTVEQKLADFEDVALLYAKHYGPYEWKKQVRNYNLFDIRPWLARVRQTTNDLDYLEILVEYVATLDDAHSLFALTSTFSANLGFSVDIYENRVLIDGINRTRLPLADFPFQIGDELVMLDGRPVEDWIRDFGKYSVAANPRSTRRSASSRLVSRPQALMPHAHQLGDTASIAVRRQSGDFETYQVPWLKQGTPLTTLGTLPALIRGAKAEPLPRRASEIEEDIPEYLRPMQIFWNASVDPSRFAVLGFGARNPVFRLPAGFEQRLGRVPADFFFSGVYESEGLRIGFIRIPNYSPPSQTTALQQFAAEIQFMQANTDGLIIDEMRNPGGSVLFCESLLRMLHPFTFRTLGFELRATVLWQQSIASALLNARLTNAPQWTIQLYEAILGDIQTALSENRGQTGPLPLGGPTLDLEPVPFAYSKPILVLVDEFSASGGDMFPAVLQDNARAKIFGWRTMGAGGSVVTFDAAPLNEGAARVTLSLMNRKNPIVTSDYPTTRYVENVGVRPDIEEDYMTLDNLLNGGRTYVERFTAAMVEHIRDSR